MLRAQHPEFEMLNQGIHTRSGVAADCHMPFQRVGAMFNFDLTLSALSRRLIVRWTSVRRGQPQEKG
jgi:hypothetical protein